MDVNVLPPLGVVLLALILQITGALEPFDLLYDNGVEAFSRGDYASVVRYMEEALASFSRVRQTKIRCRLKCEDQHRIDSNINTDLFFFDSVLRRAACLNACIEERVGTASMHAVSEDVIQDFHRRIPYNYLQLAYRKVEK
ncbi:hypothetical protein AOLI_G00144560 [Acnodon oligacanthus]